MVKDCRSTTLVPTDWGRHWASGKRSTGKHMIHNPNLMNMVMIFELMITTHERNDEVRADV